MQHFEKSGYFLRCCGIKIRTVFRKKRLVYHSDGNVKKAPQSRSTVVLLKKQTDTSIEVNFA